MRNLALLLLLLAPPTLAAEPPLTADEAVDLALTSNGALKAELARVDEARGALLTARGLPNPSVEIPLVEWDGEAEWGLHGIEAEYELSHALLAPLRVRPARADLDAARLRAADASLRLGYEVREAVHAAQAAERRYAAAADAIDAWAAGVETAQALFAAGNIPELDVAAQEADYERARIGLAGVELDLLTAREHLARLLGGEVPRPLAPLAGPAELVVPDDLEDRAIASNLELKALDAGISATSSRATLTRAERFLPSFGVFVESEPIEGRWDAEAGVHVTVPLFSLGRGELVALGAQQTAQRSARSQLEAEVRSAAREARARLISAHDRATRFEQVVLPARRRVSRQTLLQYNAMQVGIYQLLDARRQELEAEATYAELLAELSTAEAALETLLAGARVAAAPLTTPTMTGASSAAGGH